MILDLVTLEDGILRQLKLMAAQRSTPLQARIEALPDNWATVGGSPMTHSHIWVRIDRVDMDASSRAGEGNGMRTVRLPERLVEFTIVVCSNKLRTHQGVYSLIEFASGLHNSSLSLSPDFPATPAALTSVDNIKWKDSWTAELHFRHRQLVAEAVLGSTCVVGTTSYRTEPLLPGVFE